VCIGKVKAQQLMSSLANVSAIYSGVGATHLSLCAVPDHQASPLTGSLAVPRILAGAGADLVQLVIDVEQLGESEPMLLAGAALAYSWLDIAESALARTSAELARTPQPEVADLVSLALLQMAMARQHGDAGSGLSYANELKDLVGKFTISERASTPELSPLIDYYVAGFELCGGDVDTARWRLERGAGRFRQWLDGDASPAEQLVRANCAGQLSWIDAFCGNLRRATWYATTLITDRPTERGEIGLGFAHLANAWAHLERAEIVQARQHLDHACVAMGDRGDPLLAAAHRLTQVRLATIADEPETALRLLHAGGTDGQVTSGWFADQFVVASAEAYLAASEPQQAIVTLIPEPDLAGDEAKLITAKALWRLYDLTAAEATLAKVPSDPAAISITTQVQRLLLAAELAAAHGNDERAQLDVDRTLRIAAKEQLRTSVGLAGDWLKSFVGRNADLAARHSAFLKSIPEQCRPVVDHRVIDHRRGLDHRQDGAALIVPLSARETEVLRALADYCSNEEIAADLVLSLNTVKTHMRSLFQKLSVTRRAEAVRRGRALGLC
jgi:LuxR family transcriptional regulator, maltose regulon positive regulatory protein